MKAAIISEIGARQAGAAASPVEAVVKAVDPKLTTADAKAFAPKMRVISSYSVYYFVIVNNHLGGNIEGPATVINGTVVPAGAKFDFWKVVGDLHNAPGTGPGNAIEGGKITVTGAFGGGICTTSTTLFNAAFRAGMVPLARQNHNEFINRYPPGLDATVWIVGNTKQTMSFRNDTKYPILISRTITDAGSKRWLTFKIWSVPNGRKATVTNTVIQPGERAIHRTVKDPTKPVGYTLLQQRRGERRQGVDHRDDLRPRQGPLAQALLLELPSRGRRHHRGDQEDLTPAWSRRRRSTAWSNRPGAHEREAKDPRRSVVLPAATETRRHCLEIRQADQRVPAPASGLSTGRRRPSRSHRRQSRNACPHPAADVPASRRRRLLCRRSRRLRLGDATFAQGLAIEVGMVLTSQQFLGVPVAHRSVPRVHRPPVVRSASSIDRRRDGCQRTSLTDLLRRRVDLAPVVRGTHNAARVRRAPSTRMASGCRWNLERLLSIL